MRQSNHSTSKGTRRSDDRADIGPGIEHANGKGALALGEPVGHGADAGGEIAAFTDAQTEPGERERNQTGGKAMRDVADRPDDDGNGIAQPRAQRIDDFAEREVADGIGHLEPEHDAREIAFRPMEIGSQRGLEHADHLPVDIVDRGGGKEQRHHDPARAPDAAPWPGRARRGTDPARSALPLLQLPKSAGLLPCRLDPRPPDLSG
jgi:hypothetical protein